MLFKLPFVKEDPSHYDQVTGQILPESAEKEADEALEARLQEARDYQSLAANPGWQRIRAEIDVVLAEAQEKLLQSRNPEHTRNLQEFILARRSLLREIEGRISEGKSLLEER